MKRGFTFLELLIVLLLIAIVAALSLPGIVRRLPLQRRNAAVTRLEAELKAARVLAITESGSAEVEIDSGLRTLTVSIDRNGNHTNEASEVSIVCFAASPDVTINTTATRGAFNSRGMFSSPVGAWSIGVGASGWGEQFVYVFQSGQVVTSDEPD